MFLRFFLVFVAVLLVVASTTRSFEIKRIIRAQDQQQQQQQQQYQYQPPPPPLQQQQQQQPPYFRVNQQQQHQQQQQQQQYQHIQVNPGETPQEAAERFRRQRSEIYHKVKSKIEQQQKEELLAQQQYMLGMQDEDGDAAQQKKPPGDIFVDHIFRPNEPPFVEICEGRRAETPGYHLQRLFEMSYDTVANFCYNLVHPSQWGNFFVTKDEPKTAPKEAASTKKPAQSSNGSSSGDGSILWRILSAILLLDGIDSPPRPKEDPSANSTEEQGIIGLFMDALLHGDALAIFSNAIFFTMLCVLVYIIWRIFLVFSNIMSPQRQQQQQQSFWDKWIDSIWWWQSSSVVGGQQQQSDGTIQQQQQQLMTDNDYQQYYNQGQDYYDDSDTAEIYDTDAEYQEYGQH